MFIQYTNKFQGIRILRIYRLCFFYTSGHGLDIFWSNFMKGKPSYYFKRC